MSERFFLDTDGDGHWYVVPVAKKDEWAAWRGLGREDDDADEAPDWVFPVGGAPSLVTFADARIS